MPIIDEFTSYYEESVKLYSWFIKECSGNEILLSKSKAPQADISKRLDASLEKSFAEFNLGERLNIPPAEYKDEDRVFPLECDLRNQYERIFSVDFSKVLIHLGAKADLLTRDLNAQAVTKGQDIYFRSDQYAPHTQEGQTLLAHELKHVQQFQTGQNMSAPEDIKDLEHGADSVEGVLSSAHLHSLSKPVLSDDSETGTDETEENLISSIDGIASQSDFPLAEQPINSKETINIIRVHLDSGNTIDFTQSEYQELLKDLERKLGNYLEDQEMALMPEDYLEFMKRVTDKMKLGTIL